jgi:hypothetical protein
MTRRCRTLWSAFAVVSALSALPVPAASADEFTAEGTPLAVTGTGGAFSKFETTAGIATCGKASYTGTLISSSTSLTLTPSYSECTAFGFPATVDMNGCTYILGISSGSSTQGAIRIECPFSSEITVTAVAAGVTKCTLHIPSQYLQSFPSNSVQYWNTGTGTTRQINAEIDSFGGMSYSHTKGTGVGACTSGSSSSGGFDQTVSLTGEFSSLHFGIFLS